MNLVIALAVALTLADAVSGSSIEILTKSGVCAADIMTLDFEM